MYVKGKLVAGRVRIVLCYLVAFSCAVYANILQKAHFLEKSLLIHAVT